MLGETSMRLIRLVIWYSPVGIVFLVAKEVLDMEDLGSMLASLGLYMLTVLMCALYSLTHSLKYLVNINS